MTVKELREALARHPDDAVVVYMGDREYGDYHTPDSVDTFEENVRRYVYPYGSEPTDAQRARHRRDIGFAGELVIIEGSS